MEPINNKPDLTLVSTEALQKELDNREKARVFMKSITCIRTSSAVGGVMDCEACELAPVMCHYIRERDSKREGK